MIEHASVMQRNLAQVIAESLRQVVDRGAQYALTIGSDSVPCAPSRSQLSSLLVGERAYNRAALFDLNGYKTYSSSPGSISATLAAKIEDLIVSLDRESMAPIVVGPLSRTYGESWQVPLLLPVRNPSGEYCSILMLHLDLGYLLRLYQDIEIGRTGAIQILHTDGTELARTRNSGLEIGAADNIASPLMPGMLLERTRITPLFNDGNIRLVSLKEVEGHPIVVTVSNELGDVLNEFESRRNKYSVSLFMLTLVVLAMTALVVAVIRRQRRYVDAIEHSESEKQDLIDQLKEEKLHAYELASSDHLTGLANRRLFLSLASSHLARAQRSREHYALMFLDLDRFKAINDNLGHRVGDLLLQHVSQKLRNCLRKSDVIARFGGDEFVILITGVDREEDIVAIAAKLVTSVGEACDRMAMMYKSVRASVWRFSRVTDRIWMYSYGMPTWRCTRASGQAAVASPSSIRP